ncbi:MAG: DUF72 domain-containing protein [Ideonella sp.]|nr:DUF72 domain-containing protein [Ideonella sp.]
MPAQPQADLFGDPAPDHAAAGALSPAHGPVEPAPTDPTHEALAQDLGPHVRLGTSSWHFPGWAGLVWRRAYPEAVLSSRGLAAYARHPLLRTVSLDRSFYRPLDADQFKALAAQVPDDFRFVVKAPALVTDASRRDPSTGQATGDNPGFLDPLATLDLAWRPARDGLGDRLGVLVLQLSPLPTRWRRDPAAFLDRLHRVLAALAADGASASPRVAVEVRDPELLGPDLAEVLRRHGVRYAVGLHDRMPPLEAQLPMLRALWPGPLVVRWNLQRGLRYAQAKDRFDPFDRLVAPDVPTRTALAQLVARTAAAGQDCLVTINNKAEGSAPQSVLALARAVAEEPRQR